MTHSESIGNIAAALVKAQAAIKPVHKTSTNPFFHSKYANLETVSEACMSALGANGIAVVQSPSGGDGATVGITTMLLHTSGEWLCETAVYPLAKSDPQGVGSAITYGRRYGLAAMVGLVSDEDDDGNGASAGPNKTVPASGSPNVSKHNTPTNSQPSNDSEGVF